MVAMDPQPPSTAGVPCRRLGYFRFLTGDGSEPVRQSARLNSVLNITFSQCHARDRAGPSCLCNRTGFSNRSQFARLESECNMNMLDLAGIWWAGIIVLSTTILGAGL